MKNKIKYYFLLLLLLFFNLYLFPYQIEFKDSVGNNIKITNQINRIITLQGSLSEIICALDMQDKIIGCTTSDNYPEIMKHKTKIGSQMTPSLEKIISLSPDLVLTTATRQSQLLMIEKLKQQNILIISFNSSDFKELKTNIILIGKILNNENRARDLVENINERLIKITKKVDQYLVENDLDKPKVFFEVKSSPILFTRGNNSIINEVIRKAGCASTVNISKSMIKYSIEELIESNPDIYLIQKGPMNKYPYNPSENKLYKNLNFTINKKIFLVDEILFSRSGPRSVDAVEVLAHYAYPELFTNTPSGLISQTWQNIKVTAPVLKHFGRILRILFLAFVGIFIGNLLDYLGIMKTLARPGKYLVRLASLPEVCLKPILFAFVSGVSANSSIQSLKDNEQINDRQLFFASAIASFFSTISHFPSIAIPLFSLLGLPGLLFILIRIMVSFIYLCITVLLSHFFCPYSRLIIKNSDSTQFEKIKLNQLFRRTWGSSKKLILRIIIFLVPVYIIIQILTAKGFFNNLNNFFPKLITEALPSEMMLIIAGQFTHLLNGAALASDFLTNGFLTGSQVLFALLIGSFINMPVRTIRHSLPVYIGIFNYRMGIKILLINQISRSIITLIIIYIFYKFFL